MDVTHCTLCGGLLQQEGVNWDWVLALALVWALMMDILLGEPAARWHPVVWMGNGLAWAGPRVAPVASADDRGLAPDGWAFAAGAPGLAGQP